MIVRTVLRVALGALAGAGLGMAGVMVLPPLAALGRQAPETRTAALPAQEAHVAASLVAAPEDVPTTEATPEPRPDPRPASDPAPATLGPGFDTVRLEPDGTGLVAGRAEPGALVSVLAGDEAVAEVAADTDGRFVAFLSLPEFETPRALSLRDEAGRMSDETVILAPTRMPAEESAATAVGSDPAPDSETTATLAPRAATQATGPASPALGESTAAIATPQPGAPESDRMSAAAEVGMPEVTIAALEPRSAAPTSDPAPAGPDLSTRAAATPEADVPASESTARPEAPLQAASPTVGELDEAAAASLPERPVATAPVNHAVQSSKPVVVEGPEASALAEIEPAAARQEAGSAANPEATRTLADPAGDGSTLAAVPNSAPYTFDQESASANYADLDRTEAADAPAAPTSTAEAAPSAPEATTSPPNNALGEAAVANAPEVAQPPATAALSPMLGAGAIHPDSAATVRGQDTAAVSPSSDPPAAPPPDAAPSASPAPIVAGSVPVLGAPETPQPPGQAPVLLSDAQGVRVLQPALPSGAGPEVLATVALDAIAYDGAGEVVLSGRGNGGTVRLYLDNRPAGEAAIGADGQWVASLPEAAPGVYTLRLDQLDAAGEVVSRIETPFKREERASLHSAMAEAQEAGQTIAVRVVQPGHTLWAIARDRYGEGMMFVSVFEANRSRIRDPDLIYPGQVFVLPATQGR